MKKILVFMGTYNGQQYVSEQIQSILDQQGVKASIAIRDDCSKDNTPEILQKFKKNYPERIQLFLGDKNLFPFNYDELTRTADIEGFDYYAFSDHDDVWMKDKLAVAVAELEKFEQNKPVLYCSNLAVTDADLNYRFDAYPKGKIAAKPETCFVDYNASANTFVFNKAALDIYRNGSKKDFYYGDVWLQLVVFFVGTVIYDDEPHIWFRRTGNNVSGERDKGIKLWLSRLGRIKKEKKDNLHMHSDMAANLLECYGAVIDEDKRVILETIAEYSQSFSKKMRLLFSPKIKSLSFSRNITFKGRILLNLL